MASESSYVGKCCDLGSGFFLSVFFVFSSADSKRVYCTRVTLGHKRTELVQNAKGPGQRASGTVLVVRKVVIFPADLGEVTFRVY